MDVTNTANKRIKEGYDILNRLSQIRIDGVPKLRNKIKQEINFLEKVPPNRSNLVLTGFNPLLHCFSINIQNFFSVHKNRNHQRRTLGVFKLNSLRGSHKQINQTSKCLQCSYVQQDIKF